MKKILFGLIALSVGFISSCTNDDIEINSTTAPVQDALTISVDLSKFYSGYTFDDTKHNIDQIAEAYRTFNSESEMLIQVRTLIYNKVTEELVDSIVNFVTNTNSVTSSKNLLPGNYYAVTTLSFANKNKTSYWVLYDKEKISTAKLHPRYRFSKWSILSQSTDEFSVTRSQSARVNTVPAPLGALVYFYLQNFQYADEASYGEVVDNKVRRIALYSKRRADSYNIDPNASSKYNYAEETTSSSWYIDNAFDPDDFVDEDNVAWTYFKTNLYGYCYILEPEQRNIFGYILEGDDSFKGYGEQNTNFTPGTTYLAYWDYFKIGNPYLGVADNNHWNDYKITRLYKTPYTEWGATKSTVKKQMESDNYELFAEDTNYLAYDGKYSELYSYYDFNTSGKLDYIDLYFNTSITLATLEDYVAKNADAEYYTKSDDGSTTWYLTKDGKSAIGIASITYDDGTSTNVIEYVDNTGVSAAARRSLSRNIKNRKSLYLNK